MQNVQGIPWYNTVMYILAWLKFQYVSQLKCKFNSIICLDDLRRNKQTHYYFVGSFHRYNTYAVLLSEISRPVEVLFLLLSLKKYVVISSSNYIPCT